MLQYWKIIILLRFFLQIKTSTIMFNIGLLTRFKPAIKTSRCYGTVAVPSDVHRRTLRGHSHPVVVLPRQKCDLVRVCTWTIINTEIVTTFLGMECITNQNNDLRNKITSIYR